MVNYLFIFWVESESYSDLLWQWEKGHRKVLEPQKILPTLLGECRCFILRSKHALSKYSVLICNTKWTISELLYYFIASICTWWNFILYYTKICLLERYFFNSVLYTEKKNSQTVFKQMIFYFNSYFVSQIFWLKNGIFYFQ